MDRCDADDAGDADGADGADDTLRCVLAEMAGNYLPTGNTLPAMLEPLGNETDSRTTANGRRAKVSQVRCRFRDPSVGTPPRPRM